MPRLLVWAFLVMQVNRAYKRLLNSQARYVFVLGGAGAGKSFAVAQKIAIRANTEVGHKILVVRKIDRTIKDSVFAELLRVLNLMDVKFVHTVSPKKITLANGNEIIFYGLDDPEKIKSISGITSVWVEEATELNYQDFAQLTLRVRGETQNYKQFILSFNPIDELHWLKTDIIDKQIEGLEIIHTTYKNNYFLDAEYISMLENQNKLNETMYRVYTLGEWGKVATGAEYFKLFRQSKNTGITTYNPDKPLLVSFDFNVNPYVSCSVWQVSGTNAYMLEEVTLKSPRNTTRAVCKELLDMYPNHQTGVFVFGDPAGKARDTRTESGGNDYSIIQRELAEWRPQFKIQNKAPSLNMSGQFINECFAMDSPVKITIGSHCKLMIQDLLYLKEDAEGGTLKEKIKDTVTGITYEKYGHLSDGLRYFITSAYADQYKLFLSSGKKLKRV
jgi:hypothetical protein